MNVNDIREYFKAELAAERFTVDRRGSKTIEMLGASFIADEPAIFGTPNKEYITKELNWYDSQSTNIADINGSVALAPDAWRYTANKHGEINSNYGNLVFSPKYFTQFNHALIELIGNRDSRRAQMVYNRPSIWNEYNENGKNDFICTNAQTFYIRDDQLHMVSQMRSNDVVYGYKNDFAWAKYLMHKFIGLYNQNTPGNEIRIGTLSWQVMNLHVYEKHFKLVK